MLVGISFEMNGGIINSITPKTSLSLMTFESLIKKAFFIFLFFVVIRANAEESNITVLMYHRIGDDRYPSTNISQELFKKHIGYLVEQNIKVLPITELSKYLKKQIAKCKLIFF